MFLIAKKANKDSSLALDFLRIVFCTLKRTLRPFFYINFVLTCLIYINWLGPTPAPAAPAHQLRIESVSPKIRFAFSMKGPP